jgi:beta-glucanase (GH16 family)
MRAALSLAVALGFAACAAADIPGWKLVWSDEFTGADGSAPDAAKWAYDTGGGGWGNNELQYYTDRRDNSRIEGGILVIEARAENFGGRNHTSARLLTRNKASWTYGRIEARIKVPRGRGIWPAFWMLGTDIGSVGWPNCGEIDIMENIGSVPATLHGTIHGPGYSGGNGISGSTILASGALADDFRIYAIEWEENRIRWFLDGVPYFTVTPASLPGGAPWVFDKPQFLILNIAVGGNWPGSPDATTVFPQRMAVDYVRVYSPVVPPERVGVDAGETWNGYMNVSNLPANGGTYQFGQVWNPADLRAGFEGGELVLRPNTINDPSPYWYVGGGAPGRPGNKRMAASMYVEKTGGLSGKTVVFTGRVTADTLTSAHQVKAFIRDFAPDFSSSNAATAPLREGPFRVRLDTAAGAARHVQYGFETTGVNVWPADAEPFGSMRIAPVDGDPFATWITGYEEAENPALDLTESGDADGDGRNNLTEFALHGSPFNGDGSGFLRSRIEAVSGIPSLVLTLPVRGTPTFAGSPAKSAMVDGITYSIEGSANLGAFNSAVEEVAPASSDGMPALQSGWTYRSFRLASGGGLASSGFLRVRIAGSS